MLQKNRNLHPAVLIPVMAMLVALEGCSRGNEALAEKKPRPFDEVIADQRCLSCHMPDNRMGAPSWSMVAAMYKGRNVAKTEEQLRQKIVKGGSGAWGKMDMPPHPELKEPDLSAVVRTILASNIGPETLKKAEKKSHKKPSRKKPVEAVQPQQAEPPQTPAPQPENPVHAPVPDAGAAGLPEGGGAPQAGQQS